MTRPTHKPAVFSIRTDSGPEISPANAHRMNIAAIRRFMENAAMDYDEQISLINETTRNSWTVDQAGRWT